MQTVNGNWATCLIFNIYYFRYGYIFTSECMPLIYDWQSEMQAIYKWQPGWRFADCIEATHRDKLVVCVSNKNGQWVCHGLAMTMRRHTHTHQFNGNTENCSANWKSQIRTSETHFSIDYFLAHCPTSVWMILGGYANTTMRECKTILYVCWQQNTCPRITRTKHRCKNVDRCRMQHWRCHLHPLRGLPKWQSKSCCAK